MAKLSTNTEEAYRLAEQRLEWQFTSALAADQRAVSAAGILIGAAAVSAALAENAASPTAMLVGAAGLTAAAFLAWHSALPVKFYAPGAHFADFAEDIAADRDPTEVKTELGAFHDKHINANERVMEGMAKQMKRAFYFAIVSVALTIGGQMWATLAAGNWFGA